MRSLVVLCAATTALVSANAAQAAPVTIGGTTFDETAFVDAAVLESGSFRVEMAATPEEALIGSDTSTVASCAIGSGACSFVASFIDNVAINGAGDDIIFYTAGGNGTELFDVTINGVTQSGLVATATGDTTFQGYGLFSYALNLDLFGVSAGAAISSFRVFLGVGGVNAEEFVAFAALNSAGVEDVLVTPIPAAFLLYATGFAALSGAGAFRRKKKKLAA